MRDFDCFSFTGLTHLYKSKKFKNERIYHGILTPVDWDEFEKPTNYSLFTIDEEDIPLHSPHLKKKFYSLINRPVEIVGELRRNQWGDKYLRVKKIRKIKDSEYERISSQGGGVLDQFILDERELPIATDIINNWIPQQELTV